MVRAVWDVMIGARTGTFTVGENLKWPGTGGSVNGKYLSDGGSGGHLYLYMTVDTPEPVVGNILVGVSSGAQAPITLITPSSFPDWAGSPPRFLDSPAQGPIATTDIFFIPGEGPRLVGGAATIKRSSFELDQVWNGNAYNETTVGTFPTGVQALVARDRTPTYSLPLLGTSDKFSGDVFSEAMRRIEAHGLGGTGQPGGGQGPGPWVPLAMSPPWVQRSGSPVPSRCYYPDTDMVGLKGEIETGVTNIVLGTNNTIIPASGLPTGWRPADNLTLTLGGGERITINANGSIVFAGPAGLPAVNLNNVFFRADGS